MDALAAVVMLAWLCEWVTERFVGAWLTGWVMVAAATVVGVALCLLFRVDGIALLGLPAPVGSPYTGQIITGLIVGAGSDTVHNIFGARRTV